MQEQPITVYGTRWCIDCYRAKKILDKYQVPYHWIDINRDADAKTIVGKINNGKYIVPTLVFKDGSTLSEPSNQELRNKINQEFNSQDA
jgi:glutaredoxin-like protein